jgi:hypothetical protein
MENKVFHEAKELNEKIDLLSSYKNKLYHAKGGCKGCKSFTIEYTIGQYNAKREVILRNEASDFIDELLSKEIDRVAIEIKELENKFKEL